MVRFLGWTLVFSIALYFFGIMVLILFNQTYIPVIVGISMTIAVVSGILLLIILLRERRKDKEAEKDDLDKY